MEKKPVSHITAGLLIAGIGILLFIVYYFMGLSYKKGFISWLPAILTIALYIIFVVNKSKATGGNETFGSLFGYGFKTAAIATLITVAFVAVFLYIFPDYKQGLLDNMSAEFDKNPSINEEQRDMIMGNVDKYFMISAIGGGIFSNLIIGVIGSLLGAAFAKKNPKPTPFQ